MIHKASRERDKMGITKEGRKARKRETSYLTRMLLLVSVAYVVTSIPLRAYDVVIGIPEVNEIYDMKDEYWVMRYYCQYFIIEDIWEINFAINFYLYCVGGGKKFRNDVRERLKKLCRCL